MEKFSLGRAQPSRIWEDDLPPGVVAPVGASRKMARGRFIVLPTQLACHKIKEPLVNLCGWLEDRIRLVTGVDKEDSFEWGHT